MKKYVLELVGTMMLVLFGTGVAVSVNGDVLITSLTFGVVLMFGVYTIGSVSGCHVNPAVSLAMLLSKRMDSKDFICYVIAQILGALAGTGILYFILSNTSIGTLSLGANGYGNLSNSNITLIGALVVECILSFVFIYTVLRVTSKERESNGIVIGLVLMLVHLIGINLTGTSVNPARSLAPAIFMGGEALAEVWVFVVSPLIGAVVAVIFNQLIHVKDK